MSRSLQEYHAHWQQIMQQWKLDEILDADLTNESCVIFESAHSTPMGEGATALPDFGDAICYYRYYRVPDELEPQRQQESSINGDILVPIGLEIIERRWEHRRPKHSDDELQARRAAAEQALDGLLQEFIKQGYRTEMSNHLREIVNHSLLDFELHEVYVLSMDLEALLSFLGNPLADYDTYENEEEAEAHAPAFDLNNPEHREALKYRIFMVGR